MNTHTEMKRLSDLALLTKALDPRTRTLQAALPRIPHIVADNVVRYFLEENPQEQWGPQDLPLLVPPFKTMWIEGHRSERIVSETHGVTPAKGLYPRLFGIVVGAADEPDQVEELASFVDHWHRRTTNFARNNPKWTGKVWDRKSKGYNSQRALFGCLWMQWESNLAATGPILDYVFFTDKEGNVEEGNFAINCPADLLDEVVKLQQQNSSLGLDNLVIALLLAISFMNCKNVTRTRIEPPEKLSRVHAKRYGHPLNDYHVINIHPVRVVSVEERKTSATDKEAIQRALHICRGHFAQYDDLDGHRLFGRLAGNFWVPAHTRGGQPGEAKNIGSVKYKVHTK